MVDAINSLGSTNISVEPNVEFDYLLNDVSDDKSKTISNETISKIFDVLKKLHPEYNMPQDLPGSVRRMLEAYLIKVMYDAGGEIALGIGNSLFASMINKGTAYKILVFIEESFPRLTTLIREPIYNFARGGGYEVGAATGGAGAFVIFVIMEYAANPDFRDYVNKEFSTGGKLSVAAPVLPLLPLVR